MTSFCNVISHNISSGLRENDILTNVLMCHCSCPRIPGPNRQCRPVCESVEHNIFGSDAVVAVPVQILISACGFSVY